METNTPDTIETELLATELANQQSPTENLRRNGKIARLPKETRDLLNHMLDDGLPYRVIIDELGDAGQSISPWPIKPDQAGSSPRKNRHRSATH